MSDNNKKTEQIKKIIEDKNWKPRPQSDALKDAERVAKAAVLFAEAMSHLRDYHNLRPGPTAFKQALKEGDICAINAAMIAVSAMRCMTTLIGEGILARVITGGSLNMDIKGN